jgi:branched-chain amino acid transport system substrate-binding protein
MKKTIIWTVIIVVVVGGLVWAGTRNDNDQPGSGLIKIAALLHLSGDAAAWGENAQRAIQLATEQVNGRGGINGQRVEVIYEDTGADPKRAVSAFQKVTSIDRVTAVIGPLSQTEDLAVMSLIEQTGTPTIIPGYVPLVNRTNLTNPLIIWMDAEVEAGRLAQYVFDQGVRTVGVIGTLDSWENTVTRGFSDKFKSLGGTVAVEEIVQPQASDMKASVTKVLATRPEAVYLGTYYQFVNSTKVLNDLGYKGRVYGIEIDDYLAGETSGWTNGLRFIAPDYYRADFVKMFEDKFGQAPGLPAGQAYDATNVLFSFLKQGTSQGEIIEAMKNFKNYDGVSGKLEIASDGRPYLPTALFELQNGKVVRLEELK